MSANNRFVRRPSETNHGESGFTLTELSMAVVLLGVILALIAPTFLALNDSVVRTQAQTVADDALRGAQIALARQVSSASVLYSPCPSTGINYAYMNAGALPACGNGAGFAELMYTGGNGGQCTQWRVYPTPTSPIDPLNPHEALLQVRSWNPSTYKNGTIVPFVTAVTGAVLVNSTVMPFAIEGISGPQADVLVVDFLVAGGSKSPTVEIKTQIAAQGINPGAETSLCNAPPPSGTS